MWQPISAANKEQKRLKGRFLLIFLNHSVAPTPHAVVQEIRTFPVEKSSALTTLRIINNDKALVL